MFGVSELMMPCFSEKGHKSENEGCNSVGVISVYVELFIGRSIYCNGWLGAFGVDRESRCSCSVWVHSKGRATTSKLKEVQL